MPSIYPLAKRALDITASAVGLAATWPLLAAIAVAVKVDSKGPVLFGHERVGRGGRRFRTWKFRSMVSDAEQAGPPITTGGDRRVTRVGRVLRATKLDELPQLVNVLVGEMSLVGPRPEVQRYVDLFADDYRRVLAVRPGITDEASIEFRNEEEILARATDPEREYREVVLPRKLELNKEYVRDPSLERDLSILLRTLMKVVMP